MHQTYNHFFFKKSTDKKLLFKKKESLFAVFILFFFTPYSEASPAITHPLTKTQLTDLSHSEAWRTLLHYYQIKDKKDYRSIKLRPKKNQINPQAINWISFTDDDKFFLSPQGKTKPTEELEANISGFLNSNIALKDEHPQCRFPARFFWMKQQINGFEQAAPKVICPKFTKWHDTIQPNQVTVIFPEAFMNNPSSLFGHIFFRIDSNQHTEKTRYLAYTIGYAAEIPKKGKQWLYVWKGLTGGYPGYLAGAPYYDKIIEYNDIESRDTWEYALNLNQQEVEQLVRHLWELRQKKFDYFFFGENCAYRLLSMLETIRPQEKLVTHFSTHTIPADTVKVLFEHGFVTKTTYRPSAQTLLKHRLKADNKKDQQLIKRIAEGKINAPFKELKDKTPQEQASILDEAHDYLQLNLQKNRHKRGEYAPRLFNLLSHRSHLPYRPTAPVPVPESPENSHRSAKIGLSVSMRDNKPNISFEGRPAFHDITDDDTGFLAGAGIDFLKIKASADLENHLQIEKFTLVDVTSLSPRDDFFKPFSWHVSTGFEQQRVFTQPWRFFLSGGRGVTYNVTPTLQFSLIGEALLTPTANFSETPKPGLGLKTHAVYLLSNKSKIMLNFERKYLHDASYFMSNESHFIFNYQLEKNHAIKLKANNINAQAFDETSLEIEYATYFD